MSSESEVIKYLIKLPASTDTEVMEWFEFVRDHGDLSLELIKLVQSHIHSSISIQPQEIRQESLNIDNLSNEVDLFDSLYNYSEASSAIFSEKKVKKKMLSV